MRRLSLLALALLFCPVAGCALPGYRLCLEYTQPPVLIGANQVTPVAAAPQALFATEEAAPVLHVQRRLIAPVMPPAAAEVAPNPCPPGCEPIPAPLGIAPRRMPPAPQPLPPPAPGPEE